MIQFGTSAARKAWVGALVATLGPLSVLLLATDEPLTVRSVAASVVTGLVGWLSVYNVTNKVAAVRQTVVGTARRSRRGRHEAEESSSPRNQGDY